MSETKFTPGPWRVVESDGEKWVRDVGGLIAKGSKPSRWDGQDTRYAEELVQYEANHALIAAAPDLYEALAGLLEELRFGEAISGSEAVGKAEEAISKAKGETT